MKINRKKELFLFTLLLGLALSIFSQTKESAPPTSVQIIKLEITFQNGQYYQVVKKGEQVPRIRCRVLAQGQGTIQGSWSINEHVVLTLQLQINGFQDILLSGRQIPLLPTQDSGVHSITLQFNTPLPPPTLPVLRYFVTTEQPLKALEPLSTQVFILGDDVPLAWSSVKGEYQYQLAISQTPFQFLKDNQIIWMPPMLENRFSLPTKPLIAGYVYWLIRAVSSTGRVVSASEINSFLLKGELSQAPEEVKR